MKDISVHPKTQILYEVLSFSSESAFVGKYLILRSIIVPNLYMSLWEKQLHVIYHKSWIVESLTKVEKSFS